MKSWINKNLLTFSLVIMLAFPSVILAQFNPGVPPASLSTSITGVINIILNFIWPIFIGFAVIMFLVSGFQFLMAQGEPSKLGPARQSVLWGVIGVVVGLIAFSIPLIIRNSTGL